MYRGAVSAALVLVAGLLLIGCGSGRKAAASGPDRSLLRYSANAPLDVKSSAATRQGAVDVTHVVYSSSDGARVPALFAVPTDPGARKGCLLFELGLNTNKDQARFVFDGAAAIGLSTFTIDLRQQGERQTAPGALAAALSDPRQLDALVRGTVIDMRRALDLLDARPECHHDIVYVGHSLAGAEGTLLAAVDTRIRAAVLISVSATWRDAEQDTGFFLAGVKGDRVKLDDALRLLSTLDPARWIGLIAPRPVLLLTGDQDPLVPAGAAAALASRAKAPKQVETFHGGHEPFTGAVGQDNAKRIAAFLQPVVDAAGP